MEVGEQWFIENSFVNDTVVAWDLWRKWLAKARNPDEWASAMKLLEYAGGVSRASVQLYMSATDWEQLGDETLWNLDYLAHVLGITIPTRERRRRPKRANPRGARRILLMFNLDSVPSPRFLVEVLRSLVRGARARHISLSIQGVTGTDPPASVLARALRLGRHEGVIWLRMTPDEESLEVLNFGNRTCAVVVHGTVKDYKSPIIGHVFPDQSNLESDTREWAKSALADAGCQSVQATAVVAAMPREGETGSLRDARIDAILAGLRAAGYSSTHYEEVPDYSAGNAAAVLSRWPAAQCYVCLSDEIAVAMVQLLKAHGRSRCAAVLGFDGSRIAGPRIPSFSQSLEAIGDAVWGLFDGFFRRPDSDRWPDFEPRPVALKLMA